ncbi:Cna B-type domain-containing protein [Lactovum odontotermitis]
MKKRLLRFFTVLLMLLSSLSSSAPAVAVSDKALDASQFITSVSAMESDGTAISDNKIPDTSSVRFTYNLNIKNGGTIDTSQTYTVAVPELLTYVTSTPIELKLANGTTLGTVSISHGLISIQFNSAVKTLTNVTAAFFFSSEFDKNLIDYTNGNDLLFPTQSNPSNSVHINFSKTSSGGDSSGESSIAKQVSSYASDDQTIVNWTVVVNRRGDAIADSIYQDVMENAQYYIPGSMTITYRNWHLDTLTTESGNPTIMQQSDGSQTFSMDFGALTSENNENDNAVTSVLIHYQTKLTYNAASTHYPNTASAYNADQLIDSVTTSATYRGQGGSAVGDQMIDVTGSKIWKDDNNAFSSRPASITVELLQNGDSIKQMIVAPDAAGKWNFTFSNVPEKDESGDPYVYTVNELNVPNGYSSKVSATSITNTYTANELISLSGRKTWIDQNNADKQRPSSITVHLLANGQEKVSKTVTEADNWQYSFSSLPKNDEKGQPINYSVSEDTVPGYHTTVDGMNLTNTWQKVTPPVVSEPDSDTVDIPVFKVWKDSSNADKIRPATITVNLLADGKIVQTKEFGDADNWQYTFRNLPRYNTPGQPIVYTITENPVPGYSSEISATSITNTHKVQGTTPTKPSAPQSRSNQTSGPNLLKKLPSTNDRPASYLLWGGIVLILLGIAGIIYRIVKKQRSK